MLDLKKLVQSKIEGVGVKEASKYFGVSLGTVSNWASGKTDPSLQAAQLCLPDDPEPIVGPLDPPAQVDWEGRKVQILLPVYRSFSPDTHYTLFANYAKFGPEKIGMAMEKRTLIHEARNILVSKALKTPAEFFIMCDDDMILPCGNALLMNGRYGASMPEPQASFNAISRLMSHPKEMGIVGGLYFGRHRFGNAQCSLGFDSEFENEKLRKRFYTKPIAVRWVGTGLIRIARWAIEKMKAEIDNGRFPDCKPIDETKWYGFFNPTRVAVGEDVSFGVRMGEIGVQSYLDPMLECLHSGECNYGAHNTTKQQ